MTIIRTNHKQIEIRTADERDLEQIIKLWHELMNETHDPFFTLKPNAEEIEHKFLKDCISSNDSIVYVAVESGNVFGYVLCTINKRPPFYVVEDTGLISAIYVQKDKRHQGVGKALVTQAMHWFKKKGLKNVEVAVLVENEKGVEFWNKLGFETYLIRERKFIGKNGNT
jgi:ribosomal protein S18 acetylase RimI-like enzyme